MKKIKALWELMRLEHGIMIFIGILVGSLIALNGGGFPSVKNLVLTLFTAIFLETSTFALNDYFDFEIDKKNNRTDRPLVRGDIQPKTALILFFILYPLGIISSYFVNMTCFVIALVTALFAVLYDVKMKKIKVIGNFYIAYTMAIPFVFGGVAVVGQGFLFFDIHPAIFVIALIAFLAGSGREIMKDVMDFEGDQIGGVRSFPKYIGTRKSNIVAALFYILAVMLSFFPFIYPSFGMYYKNFYYLIMVLICDHLLLTISITLIFKKKPALKLYRNVSLVAIFIGLLAFLFGVFFR